MNRYLTELIGTFFLVLTIGCTVRPGTPAVIPPLAIGAVLIGMVFAGGHISGAHYNPAVTLGVWLRGRFEAREVLPYWIAQLTGALLAALAAGNLRGIPAAEPAAPPVAAALVAELLFTFALVFVILHVATAKGTAGNPTYGLAIGFTVMAGAFAVGDISGGVFNPAVGVGVAAMGLQPWSSLWIYLVANFVGGAAAAGVFLLLLPDDR